MRHIVPYPLAGPILQFRCTDCDWSFYIEQVQREGVRQQERIKATAWFEAHNCDKFHRPNGGQQRDAGYACSWMQRQDNDS